LGYQYSNNNATFKDSEFQNHKVVGSLRGKF
jgi:hypothetical protein